MIEINLLPQSLRKAEGTPLPRLLATYIGIVVIGVLVVVNLSLYQKTPALRAELKDLKERVAKQQEEAKQLQVLEGQIEEINQHVETVKTLYRERKIWSKILWDLKQIVGFKPELNVANPDGRYLWLNTIELGKSGGRGADASKQYLDLQGYASAPNSNEGFGMVQEFMSQLNTFSATKLPEEIERDRLTEIIKRMDIERRQQMTEDGELPLKSDAHVQAEKDLALLDKRSSGDIALRMFSEFFTTIQFESINWQDNVAASKAARKADEAPIEFLPSGAQEFKIRLELKEEKQPETQGLGGRRP